MNVIAHNILAMNANRQFNITTKRKAKSTEKLSSGYRINRAADDAAGLSISEKMRRQIRGLNQASKNIQDGISLCQVADGALNETHDILQRMRELTVKAANDTNSDEDRNAIQREIDELTKEVDRIANDTSFNEEIYPLLGKKQTGSKSVTYDPTKLIPGIESNVSSMEYAILNTGHVGFYSFEYENAENARKFKNAMNDLHLEYKEKYMVSTIRISNNRAYLDVRQTDMGSTEMYNAIVKETVPSSQLTVAEGNYEILSNGKYRIDFGNNFGYIIIGRTSGEEIPTGLNKNGIVMAYRNSPQNGYIVPNGQYSLNGKDDANLWIQMGAEAGQGMYLSLVDATAKGIGITDPPLDVTNYSNASSSMTRLSSAIEKVSSYRIHFGVQQNRLEYGMAVDDNTSENTQAAESKIRDTDMAKEMVSFSKERILENVSQAMLAQANQNPQGILSMLN